MFLCSEMNFRQMGFSETELPGIRLLRLSGWFRVTRLCPVYTGGQKWGRGTARLDV